MKKTLLALAVNGINAVDVASAAKFMDKDGTKGYQSDWHSVL